MRRKHRQRAGPQSFQVGSEQQSCLLLPWRTDAIVSLVWGAGACFASAKAWRTRRTPRSSSPSTCALFGDVVGRICVRMRVCAVLILAIRDICLCLASSEERRYGSNLPAADLLRAICACDLFFSLQVRLPAFGHCCTSDLLTTSVHSPSWRRSTSRCSASRLTWCWTASSRGPSCPSSNTDRPIPMPSLGPTLPFSPCSSACLRNSLPMLSHCLLYRVVSGRFWNVPPKILVSSGLAEDQQEV